MPNPLKRCFSGFFHAFSQDIDGHRKAISGHFGVPEVSHRFDMNLKVGHFEKKVGHFRFFKLFPTVYLILMTGKQL